jgi:hypothetical protein
VLSLVVSAALLVSASDAHACACCDGSATRKLLSTAVTSAVFPGNTHDRTGNPSRVTAKPTTSCGTSSRPYFE